MNWPPIDVDVLLCESRSDCGPLPPGHRYLCRMCRSARASFELRSSVEGRAPAPLCVGCAVEQIEYRIKLEELLESSYYGRHSVFAQQGHLQTFHVRVVLRREGRPLERNRLPGYAPCHRKAVPADE